MKQILTIAVMCCCGTAFLFIPGLTAHSQQQGKDADIIGVVSKIRPSNANAKARGILQIVFIEGKKTPKTNYGKAYVDITKKTKIWVEQNGEKKPGTVELIKSGVRVRARFNGPVRESFPVQATAGEIVLIGKMK